MRERGFSLIELLVALSITCIAVAAIGSTFVTGLRAHSRQIQLFHVRANLRIAMAALTRELRGLDAADPMGGDILEMNRSSLTYRAVRAAQFLCTPPSTSDLSITVWENPQIGLRQIEPGRDSLLLFAENNPSTSEDNIWRTAGLSGTTAGPFCPGNEPGIRLFLTGLSESELGEVHRGSPVIGFQVTRFLLYPDRNRDYWVGMRELRPGTGWTITQPVFGPVTRNGLRFDFLDSEGAATTEPKDVARIGVTVVAVGLGGAETRNPVLDSLVLLFGLRNNPR